MDINKGFPTAVVIRDEIVSGNRKSDGKPFKIHIATVRWHCNEEQTRELIPLDYVVTRGQIVSFEPIMQGNNTSWRIVQ